MLRFIAKSEPKAIRIVYEINLGFLLYNITCFIRSNNRLIQSPLHQGDLDILALDNND